MASPLILHDNRFTDSGVTVTASTEDTANDGYAANAYDGRTDDAWIPTSAPAWLRVSGTGLTADAIGLYMPDIATQGASVALQYSDDGGTTWVDVISAITPTGNAPIVRQFSSQSHDDWRIYVTGATCKTAVVMIGQQLALPVGMRVGYAPIHLSRERDIFNSVSDGGQFLGRAVVGKGGKGKLTLTNLTRSWIDSNWCNLINALEAGLFFFARDTSSYPDEAALCWTAEQPAPPRYTTTTLLRAEIDVETISR